MSLEEVNRALANAQQSASNLPHRTSRQLPWDDTNVRRALPEVLPSPVEPAAVLGWR